MQKIATFFLAGALAASGRTWTSADESRIIEGAFKGFDKEKKQVSIEVEGKEVAFDLAKLSEGDQRFVRAQTAEKVDVREIVSKASLHQLKDGKFVKAAFEGEPEYYLVYFSASW